MNSQDGYSLRRSTRQKREISSKDIGKGVESQPSPETGGDDSDDSVRPRKRGPKAKPFEPRPPSMSADNRANTVYSTSRDGRLYALAGSNENTQTQMFEKMDKWCDVSDHVPEELLDCTIGWGLCDGDWNGKGGNRQQFKIFSSYPEFIWLMEGAEGTFYNRFSDPQISQSDQ